MTLASSFGYLGSKRASSLDILVRLRGPQAAARRAGRAETTTERRSDGLYEVRRHYPPTAAQLAEAQAGAHQPAIDIDRQNVQAVKADQQFTPREQRKRSIQQTIDFLEKQRADYQADLSKPNLSETDRRYMTQSIQQLDRVIAQRRQALERLEQAPDAGGMVPGPGVRFPRGQR